MNTSINLVLHNIVSIISIITIFGMFIFTYLNGPRKPANLLWCCMLIACQIFTVSHLIGVNIADPYISNNILMWNLSILFIGSFNIHALYAITGKLKEKKWVIILFHSVAVILTLFFVIFPELFSQPSVPKMYFPNYYNPGILNWVRLAFLDGICLPFMLYIVYKAYKDSTVLSQKKIYLYLFLTELLGYGVGFIANLLVYDIQFDPIWGMAFSTIFMIPFLYGSVKYGLFDVKVIAKQAFFYAIGVAFLGGLITILNYLNQVLQTTYPGFPFWAMPLVSAIFATTLAVFIWRQLRQGDLLRYEFVTTATHKFRTPLTHIKWAAENLANSKNLSEDDRTQVQYIQGSNVKLVELTGLLMNVAASEENSFQYSLQLEDLSKLAEETLSALSNQLTVKKMNIVRKIQPDCFVKCDVSKIKFITQTFIENSIHYTSVNPTIYVAVYRNGNNVVFSVRDNGIGIPKQETPFLFSKFYRGRQARLVDTEGMGVGLFISKQIIEKHHGKIWVESDGEGRGSTFAFSLPAAK